MAVSNNITSILNFIALLCSIPITGAGIWLASKPDNECVHLFRWPVLILGILLFLVSLAGFIGAFWNKQGLLAAYLFAMAVLILVLLALIVFAFVVTKADGSIDVPGRAYKEYELQGFSSWLRNYVEDNGRWVQIRSCLFQSDICGKFARRKSYFADQFFQSNMSPLESGCCKPPTFCGYNYVSPTIWINPTNPTADSDCSAWNSDQSQLCYNCNSCKAGLLGNLRHEWQKADVALIVAAVVLIWVYIIGCSAFRNAQTEDLFRRFKQGYV